MRPTRSYKVESRNVSVGVVEVAKGTEVSSAETGNTEIAVMIEPVKRAKPIANLPIYSATD